MEFDPRTQEGLAHVLAELKFPLLRSDDLLAKLEQRMEGQDLDVLNQARKTLAHLMLAVEDINHVQDEEQPSDVDVAAMITDIAATLRVRTKLAGFATVPLPRARFRRLLGHLFAHAYQHDSSSEIRLTPHGMEFRHNIVARPGLHDRMLSMLLRDSQLHFTDRVEDGIFTLRLSWSEFADVPAKAPAAAKEVVVSDLFDQAVPATRLS